MRTLFCMGNPEKIAEGLKTGKQYSLAGVRLRAPIIPKKFFHTAGNFREHAEEGKLANWVNDIRP